MQTMGVTRMRLERLADERDRVYEKMEDLKRVAEEEQRDLNDYELEHLNKYRERVDQLEAEIVLLSADLERAEGSRDVSRLLREEEGGDGGDGGGGSARRWARPNGYEQAVVYRTFAQYARDVYLAKFPEIARLAAGPTGNFTQVQLDAEERLERVIQNTTSAGVAGLLQPTHMTEIMDIIDASRPVVSSARQIPLDRGSLTYPNITGRPDVQKQTSEKNQAGSLAMTVALNTITADSYLAGGNLSWQAVNWGNPDTLALWFELAAEAYARQTENATTDVLEDTVGIGTVGTASGRLGTVGTENFTAWRVAVAAGIQGIYNATGGRHRTNTLYLSANRFFQLAALGSDQVVQISPIGNLDIGSMTGTFFGLRVVGSYGFDQDVAVVGDSSALLAGENQGNPVEMRVVEPSIGGWEVGLIGAFKSVVFDANRFYHLGTHL